VIGVDIDDVVVLGGIDTLTVIGNEPVLSTLPDAGTVTCPPGGKSALPPAGIVVV